MDPVTPLRDVRLDKVAPKETPQKHITLVITPSTTLDVVVSVKKDDSYAGRTTATTTRVYTIA